MIFSLSIVTPNLTWGPAAFAQDEDVPTPDEIDNMADPGGLPAAGLPSTDSDEAAPPVKKKKSAAKSPKKTAAKKKKPAPKPVDDEDAESTDDEELDEEPAPKPKAKPVPKPKAKPVVKPKEKPKAKASAVKPPKKKKAAKAVEEEAEADDGETTAAEEDDAPESAMTEERDPVKRMAHSKELAIRILGIGKISVLKAARKYIPKDTEVRLAERLIQDLGAKTYFEPVAVDGAFDMKSRSAALSAASKKATTDGILVIEIGLEEIKGFLASTAGRRIRTFDFKYRVGEMDEKNAVSVLTERIVEGLVQAISYRGFVTAVDGAGATINLGSNHGVKEGDVLELFEFRRPNFNSTHRFLNEVQIKKVLGPSESQVTVLPTAPKGTRITPYAKVSFKLSNQPTPIVAATDKSVVKGRWWFGFGGELSTLGAEAAAPQYASRVFRANSAPFGYGAGGNDLLTFRAAFGSAASESESLRFLDLQATYSVYQFGSAQSAWTVAAGVRTFMITVTPNPGILSSLENTTIVSPMAEIKYQFVPRGRIRLVSIGEVFWPVYTNGAAIGSLPFAFGGGAGLAIQLAITPKFGFEVAGKIRYLRRPIDGQSGVQERQSMLGTGLIFSF